MKKVVIYLFLLSFIVPVYSADMKLSPLFTNNMVVQRESNVIFFGTGLPSRKITLKVNKNKIVTYVQPDSTWQAVLPPFQLNKKYSITIVSQKDSIVISNVVAGDVWLCSGQSNMEFQMQNFSWCEDEINKSNCSDIRFYSVPNQIDLIPAKDLPKGGYWNLAIGDSLRKCSATAYFFARNLHEKTNIPIGIICSDWSGTAIEPWMSKEAIAPFPQFRKVYSELMQCTQSREQVESDFLKLREKWDKESYLTGTGIKEKWYRPETDFSSWVPVKVSDGYWENAGIGLNNFDGTVWYKTSFDLPEDYKGGNFHLFLNYIKDYNTTWVNGTKVGERFGDKIWSDYYVPEKVLREKGNILIVRVMNIEGNGGFNFHPLWGTPILNGQWYCKVDEPLKPNFVKPKIVNVNPFGYPSIIYNAMIAPLTRISIKGVVWYQGESNEGRGYEYRYLFPAMIKDWRIKFNKHELPFYFVQLANYGPIDLSGNNNDWAELRESQACALSLSHTGMVASIDLGDENNIHPENKQEVGLRLANIALADCYKIKMDFIYPKVKSVKFIDEKAIVTFSSKVRVNSESNFISGFSVAGKNKKFYQAKAVLDKDKLIVYSSVVRQPVAIRYAWAKNPGALNLIGTNGLPVLPYRSDTWKGITNDRVYDSNIVYF